MIRFARPDDLAAYTELLQQTYTEAYTAPELGLPADFFSVSIFNSIDTQDYLRGNLVISDTHKSWLCFDGPRMVGSITATKRQNFHQLSGFYVSHALQGQGIGRRLWNIATDFIGNDEILIDLFAHNEKALKIYQSWGFVLDKTRGIDGHFTRHWPEWPEGAEAQCLYMKRPAQ